MEVLLLADRVDEWLVANLHEFEGKTLASVAKGALDLGKLETEDERKEQERHEGEFRDLVAKIKETLGDRVKEVRVTSRLESSPACLVADEHDLGGNLARILKSAGQNAPQSSPIMEINPKHPMVQRLKYEEARFADWTHVLFDQALLAEGGQLEDPAGFVKRINELMLELAGGAGPKLWTPGG